MHSQQVVILLATVLAKQWEMHSQQGVFYLDTVLAKQWEMHPQQVVILFSYSTRKTVRNASATSGNFI